MRLSPDEIIYWQQGFFVLNATIVYTWAIMLALVVGASLVTRSIEASQKQKTVPVAEQKRSSWHNLLEIIVTTLEQQIKDVGLANSRPYLSFLGTLFLFIASASVSTIIPGFEPPTGSLSTTVALALCVFVAVPLFGIHEQGIGKFLKSYLEPTIIMLPFNIISEISRTLALAVRLFGNMMSGSLIIAILLAITPFIFPVIMTLLGLLTGMVQAYIFFILAAVYIAAATNTQKPEASTLDSETTSQQ